MSFRESKDGRGRGRCPTGSEARPAAPLLHPAPSTLPRTAVEDGSRIFRRSIGVLARGPAVAEPPGRFATERPEDVRTPTTEQPSVRREPLGGRGVDLRIGARQLYRRRAALRPARPRSPPNLRQTGAPRRWPNPRNLHRRREGHDVTRPRHPRGQARRRRGRRRGRPPRRRPGRRRRGRWSGARRAIPEPR